jgi:hypothetical protein
MKIKGEPIIKTDLVCIRCEPPHPKGVCTCENPIFIKESDWLNIDREGHRTWLKKYGHLIEVKQSVKL